MSFLDKVVIVTGASSGIGAATAKSFAKEKAQVVMVGRNINKLNKVAQDIKQTTGIEPFVIKADVSNDIEARAIIDKTEKQFQKLDILINNAGIGSNITITEEDYIEDFDKIMATNFRAAAVITHAAVPHLVKTKGNIINVSSMLSKFTLVNTSIYSSLKAALDHWSRCLALDDVALDVAVVVILESKK